MAQSYLFLDDQLSAGLLVSGLVNRLWVFNSSSLVVPLHRLPLSVDQCLKFLVLSECSGEITLACNAAIGTQGHNEVSHWCCQGNIVRLGQVSTSQEANHLSLTYHEDDCTTTEQFALEALLDNPLSSVHV